MPAKKKPTAALAGATPDDAPFEVLLTRLEQLVGTLEEGELSLEDSLQAYEEGVALVRRAGGRLDDMDARLEELLQDGRTRPLAFDDDEEAS